jgi:hypothetical protein
VGSTPTPILNDDEKNLDDVMTEKNSGQLMDMSNPLHVALYEFGQEMVIPHANDFFGRVNSSSMNPSDVHIMEIVNEKSLFDEEFGSWVYEQLYPEDTEKSSGFGSRLGGGGHAETPLITLGESPIETPQGHSEFIPREGDHPIDNTCSPPGRKHFREKNSSDSELTMKRNYTGEKLVGCWPLKMCPWKMRVWMKTKWRTPPPPEYHSDVPQGSGGWVNLAICPPTTPKMVPKN